MQFLTAEMLFLASSHALVLYHFLPRRNSVAFVLTGTQQTSNKQEQEVPAPLLKALARVFVGSVTFLHCILIAKQHLFPPLPLGEDWRIKFSYRKTTSYLRKIWFYLNPFPFGHSLDI